MSTKTGRHSWDKQWLENKNGLESLLAKIVARLEIDAEKEAKWLEDCRLSAIKREEEEKVRREQEAHRRAEQQKTDILLQQSELFARAQMIRAFIKEVKRKAIALGEIPGQTQQWIAWAERKADGYDPTVDSMEAPPDKASRLS